MTTPADWYPDPSDPAMLRYWDGTAWTGYTAPAPHAAPTPAPTAPAPAAPAPADPAPTASEATPSAEPSPTEAWPGEDSTTEAAPELSEAASEAPSGWDAGSASTDAGPPPGDLSAPLPPPPAAETAPLPPPPVAASAPLPPPPAAPSTPAPLPAGLARSTLFAESNLEQPTTGRMTRQNAAVVKVTLGQPLLVSRGAMIAYQGAVTFKYEGAGMKRVLKAMGTNEGMALMRCEGQGELFVSRGNRKLHLLELGPGEQLSASSRALLGFDDSVTWDIQAIRGGIGATLAGGLFNITLTGPGTVILATDWPVVLNTSEAPTCVDPNALVAWTAGLATAVRSTVSAGAFIGRGSGEAFQLEFSPGGYVIVEPEAVLQA